MPSAGKVVDSGTVAAPTVGSLVDATKAWVVDAYANMFLYLPRLGVLYSIVSNTGTTLILSGSPVLVAGEAYTIREDATTPTLTPTSGALPVANAAGTNFNVAVALLP